MAASYAQWHTNPVTGHEYLGRSQGDLEEVGSRNSRSLDQVPRARTVSHIVPHKEAAMRKILTIAAILVALAAVGGAIANGGKVTHDDGGRVTHDDGLHISRVA